jgi:hypothetical protein
LADPQSWIIYDAVRIVERTGYPTVWDFLKALQNNFPVVGYDERDLAAFVYRQLVVLYQKKQSEGISESRPVLKKIEVEIRRLALFLKNPELFMQTVRLGGYGEVSVGRGTSVVIGSLPPWESLYLTNEVQTQWIKVGNGEKRFGFVAEEAKLFDLDEPIQIEIEGNRGGIRPDVLMNKFGNYVFISIGGQEISWTNFYYLFSSAEPLRDEGETINRETLPGMESVARSFWSSDLGETEEGSVLDLAQLAKEGTPGWFDVVRWMAGQFVRPGFGEASQVLGKVDDEGRVLIRQDPGLPGGGRLTLGQSHAGKEVIGILRADPNHGTILEWYEYDRELQSRKDPLLNVHYFEDGQIKILKIGGTQDRTLGWLDVVRWLQGKNVTPGVSGESQVLGKVGSDGRVFIKSDSSLSGGGTLTIGKSFSGKEVIGQLRRDMNQGVILEWYEYDRALGQKTGPLLNAYYFDQGQLQPLNAGTAEWRTLGWLDIVRWMEGKSVKPRKDEESYFIGKANSTGLVFIKSDSNLPGGGTLSVGPSSAGKEVIGILSEDMNHGTILEWYEYDGESSGKKGPLLNAYYFDEGKLKSFNIASAEGRTLGWLDIVRWAQGKEIRPRENGESFILGKLDQGGRFFLKKDKTLPGGGHLSVGLAFERKEVIGILRTDPNHGTILEWYEYDRELQSGKVPLLNAHYFDDGKLKILNTAGIQHHIGWLDVVKWMQGQTVTSRENEESYIVAKVYSGGRVFIKRDERIPQGGFLNVGSSMTDKEMIGVLKNLEGFGTVLVWYEYDPEAKARKENPVKIHAFSEGKILDVTDQVTETLSEEGTGEIIHWTDTQGVNLSAELLEEKATEIRSQILTSRVETYDQSVTRITETQLETIKDLVGKVEDSLKNFLDQSLAEVVRKLADRSYDEGRGFLTERKYQIILNEIDALKDRGDPQAKNVSYQVLTLRDFLRLKIQFLKDAEKIGFNGVVKSLDQYFLGSTDGEHLFYDVDLLAHLKKQDEANASSGPKTNLVAEYLFHEAMEHSGVGHQSLRLLQVYLFPENYQKDVPYLRNAIREFI